MSKSTIPNPQKHSFMQADLALISPHTNLTQRERKEGKRKATGRRKRDQAQDVQGRKAPKATRLVCGEAGVRIPVSGLQVEC